MQHYVIDKSWKAARPVLKYARQDCFDTALHNLEKKWEVGQDNLK